MLNKRWGKDWRVPCGAGEWESGLAPGFGVVIGVS